MCYQLFCDVPGRLLQCILSQRLKPNILKKMSTVTVEKHAFPFNSKDIRLLSRHIRHFLSPRSHYTFPIGWDILLEHT